MAIKEISVNVSKKIGQPQYSSTMVSASITMTVEEENVADAYKEAWALAWEEVDKQEKSVKFDQAVDPDPAWISKPVGTMADLPADDISEINGTTCPKCGKKVWDNRAKIQSGEFNKKSPHFSCSDKTCGWAVWGGKYKLTDMPF